MSDLISRADAIEAKPEYRNEDMLDKEKSTYNKGWNDCNDAWVAIIKALPSADAVDCTDFIEWLVDRVLDETIWEYNSVAYGEIICRKLEKLGVLEVTEEPSYYIRHIENNAKPSDLVYRPSADAEQVIGKLKNPCDSLLTGDSDECKEQKSKLESAEAEWIPCSERLPSESGWYLITVQGCEKVADMEWYYSEWDAWNGVSSEQQVIAWMPLPKPYKGGDEE